MSRFGNTPIFPVVSRSAAQAAGLTRYFTNKPCKHGHVAQRMTCSKNCYACLKLSNKITQAERSRRYERRHPDRISIQKRKWRLVNLEKTSRWGKRWRTNNPIKVRSLTMAWRRANPEGIRAIHQRRRARKKGAPGSHTSADIRALLVKQNHICCGPNCSRDLRLGYHIDHKRPLSRGGSNYPRNIQLLCASCNTSKGARTDSEWRKRAAA